MRLKPFRKDDPRVEQFDPLQEEETDRYLTLSRKYCPKCKAQNADFATRCVECNFSPFTWRPEFKGILWAVGLLAVGFLLYNTFFQ